MTIVKKIRHFILASCAWMALLTSSSAANLGDPAAALQIAEWVKGASVDIVAGKGKQVFVVEFWATWCPPCRASIPHLTELQKKYKDKGVVFVGVSDETAAKVKPFVEQMGGKMDYTVALDKQHKTSAAYMGAYGINGIPHAFVIDKQGLVVWNGHPMDSLDSVLDKVLADKLDLGAAKKRSLAQQKLNEFMNRLRSGANDAETEKLGKELEALDKELGGILAGGEKLDLPALKDTVRLQALFGQYFQAVTGKEDKARAEKLGKELRAAQSMNADLLNELAWAILDDPRIKERDVPLALSLAKTAYDACQGKTTAVVDTYARALFDSGKVNEAIQQQKAAIELVKEPEIRKELEATLKKYQDKAASK